MKSEAYEEIFVLFRFYEHFWLLDQQHHSKVNFPA